MLHGELNTGKAKTIPGHGCESAGVSHVAGITLGTEGQRAQSQDYTDARAACRVRTQLRTVPGLLLLPLLSPISQQTCHPTATALQDCVPGTKGTCSHTCSELCRKTVLVAEVCWRTEVLWLCLLLLVQFLAPVLGFLNPEIVQKLLVDPFCSAGTAKSKGLAQQMKSEY